MLNDEQLDDLWLRFEFLDKKLQEKVAKRIRLRVKRELVKINGPTSRLGLFGSRRSPAPAGVNADELDTLWLFPYRIGEGGAGEMLTDLGDG